MQKNKNLLLKKNLFKLKKNVFYKVFFKFLLKNGNSKVARNTFKELFRVLFLKTNLGQYSILLRLYRILSIKIEVKTVKRYRRSFLVPFPIKIKRSSFLVVKWLFEAIKENKKKRSSIVLKLVDEIIRCLKGKDSHAINKRNLMINLIFKNRSNAHYRWY